jgi:3D (Asp-Asp-Asp) domain-containing protein|tara:strand:- start:915 stop:1331 length:417 start_codon:yes stop_codon:yes gene_type:complete
MGGLFLIAVILLLTFFLIVFAKEEEPIQNSAKNIFYSWEAPLFREVEIEATITGYSSSFDETDDTPFITASGTRTRKGIIACPRNIEFGTEIIIDGKRYICEDRLSLKYDNRFDIWFPTKKQAIEFGKQEKIVSILKY